MKSTVRVKLGRALPKREIEETWDDERRLVPLSLPNLFFEVEADVVAIKWDPRHIPPRSMQEIKTPFQTAIKRRFGEKFEVRWLDISPSEECSIHRTDDGNVRCAIHNVLLMPRALSGDSNPPGSGHVSAWVCPTSGAALLEGEM